MNSVVSGRRVETVRAQVSRIASRVTAHADVLHRAVHPVWRLAVPLSVCVVIDCKLLWS